MVGRIEVCIQETWRTICSNQWKEEDARVLCHQLGFSVYGLLYLILEIKCMLISRCYVVAKYIICYNALTTKS